MQIAIRDLRNVFAAAALTFGLFTAVHADAQEGRNPSQYNLENGMGLKGYDPVSYFPEGGSQPMMGTESVKHEHAGVTYMFASTEHKDQFISNPEKYEPTYGGWCAYAMARNSKVDIDPRLYTLHGNRLHFFVNRRAKAGFDTDLAGEEMRADGFWKQMSGENPRQ